MRVWFTLIFGFLFFLVGSLFLRGFASQGKGYASQVESATHGLTRHQRTDDVARLPSTHHSTTRGDSVGVGTGWLRKGWVGTPSGSPPCFALRSDINPTFAATCCAFLLSHGDASRQQQDDSRRRTHNQKQEKEKKKRRTPSEKKKRPQNKIPSPPPRVCAAEVVKRAGQARSLVPKEPFIFFFCAGPVCGLSTPSAGPLD